MEFGFPMLSQAAFSLELLLLSLLVAGQAARAASFSSTAPLLAASSSQTATPLSNGKVLVAGGETDGGFSLSVTEVADPADGVWRATASLSAARAYHGASLLPNGKAV